MDSIAKIMERVNRNEVSGCLEWQGCKGKNGYGQVRFDGVTEYVHRLLYFAIHPQEDRKLFVCHRCDNRVCCELSHLFAGTHSDNMRDMAAKGRGNAPKGERQHLAKLTEDKVREIRGLLELGFTNKEIGMRLGVNPNVVCQIKLKKTWKHVKFQ